MFHSLPAAIIAAELGFLLLSNPEMKLRLYTAGAILAGFMSHLLLDEIYSVDLRYGFPRFKKSFGTAIKVWGKGWWPNISCYAKLGLLSWLAVNDPTWLRDAAARAFHGHPPGQGQEHAAPAEPDGGLPPVEVAGEDAAVTR
jgi:hypothetical protein